MQEIQKHIHTDEVLDLYAGVGTIGLSVARDKNLTMVEVDKSAFKEMTKNLASQKLPRALGLLDKSENILDRITAHQTVILDPPRAGCDYRLINRLNTIKPSTIIYLSCNPATQARDIKFLLDHYQITSIKTFNFFPRTPHIENLVVLERL